MLCNSMLIILLQLRSSFRSNLHLLLSLRHSCFSRGNCIQLLLCASMMIFCTFFCSKCVLTSLHNLCKKSLCFVGARLSTKRKKSPYTTELFIAHCNRTKVECHPRHSLLIMTATRC